MLSYSLGDPRSISSVAQLVEIVAETSHMDNDLAEF